MIRRLQTAASILAVAFVGSMTMTISSKLLRAAELVGDKAGKP